jgi:hypothetical protein
MIALFANTSRFEISSLEWRVAPSPHNGRENFGGLSALSDKLASVN